jgi:hypothetical protein
VLLASSTFDHESDELPVEVVSPTQIRRTRWIGAAAGLVVGSVGPVGLLFERWPTSLDRSMALAMVLLALILGWIFAPQAARPPPASALRAVLLVSLVAVTLGSLLTAAIWTFGFEGSPGEVVSGIIGVWLAGLLFLGIPALLPAIAIALIWVVIVRLAVRVLRAQRSP